MFWRTKKEEPRLAYYSRVALALSIGESLKAVPSQVLLTRHSCFADSPHQDPNLHKLQVLRNRE